MRFDRSRRGFTLLEVLMAVGIFAVAAMGLLLALDATLDGAQATQREAMVRNGLANRLALASVGPLRPGRQEEEDQGVTYRVEVDREEVTNAERTLLRGFWRVRVTAEWTADGTPQRWAASHLLYRADG